MPSINIQAPVDEVFKAMCDLTRHAKWAAHDISVEAGQEGPPAVGNTYTSSHQGKAPDQLTVTEMRPNERFAFHSVMPNNWELDFTMSIGQQVEGTRVTRTGRITKMPLLMTPMKLLIALVSPVFDKKFLNNMKADLEASAE